MNAAYNAPTGTLCFQDPASACQSYATVRAMTEALASPLQREDYVIQSIPDVSPPKWHLAHTTWFFETFVLRPYIANYQAVHPAYHYLFNSYYETVGRFFPRPQRGTLSRPTVQDIYTYRRVVDEAIHHLLTSADDKTIAETLPLVELGCHHEQQHQELLLMDIKHNFGINPLRPAYRTPSESFKDTPLREHGTLQPLVWINRPGGLKDVGFSGSGFAFDNEAPRHQVWLNPYRLGSRLVNNREYLDFIEDRGYQTASLWLSEGWQRVQQEQWHAPLYWEQRDGTWWQFTLWGERSLDPEEPVCHVSYFEADAFSRWSGKRLPTEEEWENAWEGTKPAPEHFLEGGYLHPTPPSPEGQTGWGNVWEWTMSPYLGYPGYRPLAGPLGEYNGKFMSNQFVLRGGSCVTPFSHIRLTYRNFFPAKSRWPFTGIRLAQDGLSG